MEKKWLKKKFREYYTKNRVVAPYKIEKREFGFITFDRGVVKRHIGFKNLDMLMGYIRKDPPLHLYYSTALYEKPYMKNMEEKQWSGAELIFDLDADHIDTKCKKVHGDGWFCFNCLEVVKEQTIELVSDFLIGDFGISKKDIIIAFSGQRGYHVHVMDKSYFKLGQRERREIVDYITAKGLNITRIFSKGKKYEIFGPLIDESGWRGRIARWMKEYGEKKGDIELINATRNGTWGGLRRYTFKKLTNLALKTIGKKHPKIDEPVTADTKRLIRVIGSLHGKTGLKVVEVKIKDMEKFNPMHHATVFGDEPVKVKIKKIPRIDFGDSTYGPIRNEEVEIPLSIAVLFVARGDAEFVKNNIC